MFQTNRRSAEKFFSRLVEKPAVNPLGACHRPALREGQKENRRRGERESDAKMVISKKILASMMVVGLLALALGWGTHSYFSDTAKSTGNTFTAGTLDIGLLGSGWLDNVVGTWVSPTNWAPGEKVEATLYMRNFGSIGIHHIKVGVENLGGTGLAPAIILTKFEFFEGDITAWVISLIDGADGSTKDAKGSLKEFKAWCDTPHSILLFAGAWTTGPDYLAPNEGNQQFLKLEFTFDPTVEDPWYQGKTASFDLKILAYQEKEQTTPIWVSQTSYGY
jgi:predicted ribosomally synthesized peptide with SipW-like signal peptide